MRTVNVPSLGSRNAAHYRHIFSQLRNEILLYIFLTNSPIRKRSLCPSFYSL